MNDDNEVNNRFHYLRGVYDQAEEQYDKEGLLVTACLSVMCSAISEFTTQDASKLFNKATQDTETADYVANLLNEAISS